MATKRKLGIKLHDANCSCCQESRVPKFNDEEHVSKTQSSGYDRKRAVTLSLFTIQIILELLMLCISLLFEFWRYSTSLIVSVMMGITLVRHYNNYFKLSKRQHYNKGQLDLFRKRLLDEFHATAAVFMFSWIFSMQTADFASAITYYVVMILAGLAAIPMGLQLKFLPKEEMQSVTEHKEAAVKHQHHGKHYEPVSSVPNKMPLERSFKEYEPRDLPEETAVIG